MTAGDAGTMVTKARLTAGNPEGDVMWGVDNTLLSAALDGKVFTKYEPNDWNAVATNLTALVPGHELTPVDFGDVCINYDKGWFSDARREAAGQPRRPRQARATRTCSSSRTRRHRRRASPSCWPRSPSSAHDGWQDYWKALRANGVEVVDGWDDGVLRASSAVRPGRRGTRPLVVSYGSSPPAEVIFADPPRTDAPTARDRLDLLPRRSSSPACCAAPSTRRRPASSSTS